MSRRMIAVIEQNVNRVQSYRFFIIEKFLSFQLSTFYKHLIDSSCLTMKAKKKNFKKISNNVKNLFEKVIVEDEEQNEDFFI